MGSTTFKDSDTANPDGSIVRTCSRSMRKFTIIPQEKAFYDKYGLPYPELHPDEREKDRRSSMYERAFYTTKDAMTGEDIHVCVDPIKHPTWKFYGKKSFQIMREKTGNIISE